MPRELRSARLLMSAGGTLHRLAGVTELRFGDALPVPVTIFGGIPIGQGWRGRAIAMDPRCLIDGLPDDERLRFREWLGDGSRCRVVPRRATHGDAPDRGASVAVPD